MGKNVNVINWFEIPVSDFAGAKKFHETLMDIHIPENKMGPLMMGFFPMD